MAASQVTITVGIFGNQDPRSMIAYEQLSNIISDKKKELKSINFDIESDLGYSERSVNLDALRIKRTQLESEITSLGIARQIIGNLLNPQ